MKMTRLRGKSLIRDYLFSYIGVVLLACGVMGLILFEISVAELNREQQKSLAYKAELVISDLSRQYDAMQAVADDVTVNIVYKPYYLRRNKYYDIELIKRLEQYDAASALPKDIFLIYRDTDAVYHTSGVQQPGLFFRTVLQRSDGEDLFRQIQQMEKKQALLPAGQAYALFVFPVRSVPQMSPYGDILVCFTVQKKDVLDRIRNVTGGMDARVEVSCDGQLFAVWEAEAAAAQAAWSLEMGAFSIAVYPALDAAHGAIAMLQNMNPIFLLLGLLIAVGAAICIAYRNYKPIREIALRYGEGGADANASENELKKLENTIQQTLRHNAEIHAQITEQNAFLRRQLLILLLKGAITAETEAQLGHLGFHLEDPWYAVFTLCPGEAGPDTRLDAAALLLEDLSDEHFHVYALHPQAEDQLIVIVGAAEAERVTEAPELFGDLLNTPGCPWQIAGGSLCDSVNRIPSSWMAADLSTAVHPGGQAAGFDTVGFHYGLARQMLEAIRAGNEPAANQILAEFVAILQTLSPPILRYNCANLLRGMVSLGSEIAYEIPRAQINQALTVTDAAGFGMAMQEIVGRFIRQTQDRRLSVRQSFDAAVMAYIDTAFDNPDLNVASIADHFQTSTKEIIRICQDTVQMNPKEYLIYRRIEKAKQLLLAESATIAEICERVGYQNISLFIKTFKAQTGKTPSNYRKGQAE